MNPVYTPIPHINSETIDCNTPEFAKWLNEVVDAVNLHDLRLIELTNQVKDLANEVACLDDEVEALKIRVSDLEACCDEANNRLTYLEEQLLSVNGVFQMLQDQLDWIYNHLPNGTGNIPDNWYFAMGEHWEIDEIWADVQWIYSRLPATKSAIPANFKFAMGNINVMSANSGTPSLNIGIFTSRTINNNDIYFN